MNTLVVHLPLGEDRQFRGMVDLVDMTIREWNDDNDNTGATFDHRPLTSNDAIYNAAITARELLITQLCELDDTLMDAYISDGINSSAITPSSLRAAIRSATISQRGVAVLCGASLRNKGVQPLLDAVIDYLPSPADRAAIASTSVVTSRKSGIATAAPSAALTTSTSAATTATIITLDIPAPPSSSPSSGKRKTAAAVASATSTADVVDAAVVAGPLIRGDENGPLCALAFKVSHDPQTGPLVFVRVYSGTLRARDMIVNSSSSMLTKERPMRLLEVHADSSRELDELQAGDIGALIGLKATRTGIEPTCTCTYAHK